MKNHLPARLLLPATLILLLARPPAALHAQGLPPSADDEIVVMETFNINESSSADDWVASQAMSGTRTAESIANLPFQVQVMTAEFFEDFGMDSMIDQLSFISGMAIDADSEDPAQGSILSAESTFRGFKVTKMRDGFKNAPPPLLSNTRQLEVVKGPLTTLYGIAQPGGAINYISRRTSARKTNRIRLTAGNYGRLGGSVSINTPVINKKLYILAVADRSRKEGNVDYTWNETVNYFTRILYKPTRTTDLTVSYEYQKGRGNRGHRMLRARTGNTTNGKSFTTSTGTILSGPYWALPAFNQRGGPHSYYDRLYTGINVLLEQKLGSHWKFRAAYQWQEKTAETRTFSESDYCLDIPGGGMQSIYPRYYFLDDDYPYAFQADLLGEFKTGKVRHALLFLFDTAKQEDEHSYWELPSDKNRPVSAGGVIPDSVYYMDPRNPDWSTDWFSWDDLRSRDTAGGRARRDSYGLSDDRTVGCAAVERMFLFERRLIFMAGLRHDKVYYKSRSVPAYSDGDWTRSLGCNWNPHGDNRLVVFGNYSTSCNTELTVDNGTHTVMPMETGRGLETGARALLFHGKLNLTASAFQIEKHDIPQNNPDYYFEGAGTPEYTSTGVHRVRGADMELLCKPFEGLRVLMTAAYLDTKVVESADIRYPVGSRKIRTPNKTLSLALSYRFPGLLRGFSASARMSYRSGYVDSNYIAASSVVPGENNAEQLYYFAPSLTLFGGSLKYDWGRRKTAQSLSLTASNLLDKRYAGTTRNLGIGRQVTLGYSVTFR